MKYLEPILASVCFALLLLAGILALEGNKSVFGPSAGAAVAVAALAAFFVVYDMMKRDGGSGFARPAGEKATAKADVTPRIPSDSIVVVDAVLKSERSSAIQREVDGVMAPNPVALRIIFPSSSTRNDDAFEGDHLLEQLKILDEKFKTDFKYIYFAKANKSFLGYCEARIFLQMFRSDSRREIILLINNGHEDQFLKESWVESASIDSTSSNTRALQFLATQQKTSAMIVKGGTQRAIGVIDWATLVQRVLGANG